MEAFVSGEAFPPQPSWEHIKTAEYINLWLSILPDRRGRNGTPAVGQMCAGSRPREGTWGRRRGVRSDAAGKQRLRQLAAPNVPRGQLLSQPWYKTHGVKSCEGGERPASHLAGLTCYFRNWWKSAFLNRVSKPSELAVEKEASVESLGGIQKAEPSELFTQAKGR